MTQRSPLVSVITIARNDRPGLQRTVESTRAQTWAPLEHIVVDAGSTDGSREYLAQLDGSVRWTSEPDGGRYDGMNRGAARAHGEWLWFMHSGDTFAGPETVATAMSWLTRARAARWAYGLSRIGGPDACIGIGGAVPFSYRRFMLGGRPIPHQACVISRSLHDAIGGYDTTFGIGEDQRYLLAAAGVSRPVVVPEILCDFDAAGAGSTRAMRHHYADMARARRALGVTASGSAVTDALWSLVIAGAAKADRGQRALLRRLDRQTGPTASRRS